MSATGGRDSNRLCAPHLHEPDLDSVASYTQPGTSVHYSSPPQFDDLLEDCTIILDNLGDASRYGRGPPRTYNLYVEASDLLPHGMGMGMEMGDGRRGGLDWTNQNGMGWNGMD